MSYTKDRIRMILVEFINDHNEHDLAQVISYAVGYFDGVSVDVWDVILELKYHDRLIK